MTAICYATVTQWSLMTWETGVPATIGPMVGYMLVDDATGLTLAYDNDAGGLYQAMPFPAAAPAALRSQAEAGIQAQEAATPGLTFVWLN